VQLASGASTTETDVGLGKQNQNMVCSPSLS
jgi:hypothetical protein